jgi:alcohol dehydrogenase YqhD (iron-dependent ADH family)
MVNDLNNPAPGTLTEEVFSMLIEDADITSEGAIKALRAHFVQGLCAKTSYSEHGVSRSYFSQSLKRLNKRIAREARMIALCAPELAQQANVAKLLTQSQALASDLHNALTTAVATTAGELQP